MSLTATLPTAFSEVQQQLKSGQITVTTLVEQYLAKIDATANLNMYLEVYRDEVRELARRVDEKIKSGQAGRLAGMVISVKDVIAHQDHGLTASSKILGNFKSLFTATALERVLKEDAIVIGRVSCDEFAMGSSNENSAFGAVRNPLNPDYVPGGSSGASAASVAAQTCLAALGSDTGGSVRQPAAFCGLYGLKPTYGRISRWGLIAYASSFDQIGPLTTNPEDAALLLETMAGFDVNDNTSSTYPVDRYTEGLTPNPDKPLKLAILKEALESPGLDPQIKQSLQEAIKFLKAEGHTVDVVEFPLLEYLIPTYYILTTAEASSNLSRYDGIRYGRRTEQFDSLEDLYSKSRSEGFGAEVKRRILLGTFVLSAGYFDAYYKKAQKVRRLIANQTQALFQTYDLLISPTTPTTAFKIGEKISDPIAMYLSDIFTVHANLAGVPALSMPLAFHSNGLPFGIQVTADYFAERKLFIFASQLDKAKLFYRKL